MKKIFFVFGVAFLLLFIGSYAQALSVFDIQFPVPELENCADRAACKTYCDDLAHKDACVAFAQKYGLVNQETANQTKKLPSVGPGGCTSESECRAYCDDAAHVEECIAFGEEHNLVDASEIKRTKEFSSQSGPGGCKGQKECFAYCQDQARHNECLEFAHKKGFIKDKDFEIAKEIKEEGGPGGCKSQEECKTYCEDTGHIDACVSFAEQHGFIQKEDAARIKKSFGTGPGGCKGKDQCEAYCHDFTHQTECLDFAEKNGFMTADQVAQARKFVGKQGPGGCRGEECRTYCQDPAHGDECTEFGLQNGFITKEEAERAKKFLKVSQEGGPGGCRGTGCRDYCEDSAHREECFSFAKKQGIMRPEDEQNFEVGQKLDKKLKESGGPGGCKSEGECRVYCTDASHAEECVAFAATHGGVSAEQARQMLKQFTENRFESGGDFRPPADFKRFEQEHFQRFEEFKQLEEQFRGKEFPGGFPGGPGGGGPPGGFMGQEQGGPGGFPGGQGGQGFLGPGGCTGPAECIKYCTEHKEECFSGSSSGKEGEPPGFHGGPGEQCCPAPGQVPIKLRHDLLREFKQGDLPEGFQQFTPEEREKILKQKFEGFQGSSGEFPGKPSEGFMGQPGEFPGMLPQKFPGRPGEFPGQAPQGFQGRQNEFRGTPPEGFHPPEGLEGQPFQGIGPKPGTTGIFAPLTRPLERFNASGDSFQREPSQRTFDVAPGEFTPPSGGTFQPPASGFHPPEGSFQQQAPSGNTFSQPPAGTLQQQPPPSSGETVAPAPSSPPPSSPPPSSEGPRQGFFASAVHFFSH